jgi:hypothetical protein
MVDGAAVNQILSVRGALWTLVLIVSMFIIRMWNGSPAMFQQWIEYRKARAAEKSADWDRLRAEIIRLSEAERQCREDYDKLFEQLMELRKQLSHLEGYMAGQGKAAQEAAGIVAIERLTHQEKPNGD